MLGLSACLKLLGKDVQLSDEELDVEPETVIEFTEQLIQRADHFWTSFDVEFKQRFQKVLFPEGIAFNGENFETTSTVSIFNLLGEFPEANTRMATPAGFEPASPA